MKFIHQSLSTSKSNIEDIKNSSSTHLTLMKDSISDLSTKLDDTFLILRDFRDYILSTIPSSSDASADPSKRLKVYPPSDPSHPAFLLSHKDLNPNPKVTHTTLSPLPEEHPTSDITVMGETS